MWCYFRVLLGRALTIERSNELCDCESVTLTFDRSTAEALLLVCPLYLVSKPIEPFVNHRCGAIFACCWEGL
jgi:hypothetical protein